MSRAPLLEKILAGPQLPDKNFVLGGATYGQIYSMARGLQSYFATQEEEVVCLCAEDKAVIAAALLASLAGGPVLLLPSALSGQALAEMQVATGFKTAIVDGNRELPAGINQVVPAMGQEEEKAITPNLPRHLDHELLRLFTGGSSGTPRLWSKTARNLLAEAAYHALQYRLSPADRLVATVPPYHIYGLLFSVLIPFLSSAAVAKETPSFPNEIRTAVAHHKATILASIPVHFRALKGRGLDCDSLRLAFSSAGMLDREDNMDFCRRNTTDLIEVYGSTETGGIATRTLAQGEKAFRPFSSVDWRVSEERLEVRSPYVSPEVPRNGEGYSLLGDRVQLVQEHGFLLLGRATTIVKVGGKRVDLEEVRDKIKKTPGVTECLVFSRPAPGGRENDIVALIEGQVGGQELRQGLAQLLEPYAMPRAIKVVEQIPLTASGKFDRTVIDRMLET